jgi:hypothetical protein
MAGPKAGHFAERAVQRTNRNEQPRVRAVFEKLSSQQTKEVIRKPPSRRYLLPVGRSSGRAEGKIIFPSTVRSVAPAQLLVLTSL